MIDTCCGINPLSRLLIRRSEVRALVGEPHKTRGCVPRNLFFLAYAKALAPSRHNPPQQVSTNLDFWQQRLRSLGRDTAHIPISGLPPDVPLPTPTRAEKRPGGQEG